MNFINKPLEKVATYLFKAKSTAIYRYEWYNFTVKENRQKLEEGSVLDPTNHPYYKK